MKLYGLKVIVPKNEITLTKSIKTTEWKIKPPKSIKPKEWIKYIKGIMIK